MANFLSALPSCRRPGPRTGGRAKSVALLSKIGRRRAARRTVGAKTRLTRGGDGGRGAAISLLPKIRKLNSVQPSLSGRLRCARLSTTGGTRLKQNTVSICAAPSVRRFSKSSDTRSKCSVWYAIFRPPGLHFRKTWSQPRLPPRANFWGENPSYCWTTDNTDQKFVTRPSTMEFMNC